MIAASDIPNYGSPQVPSDVFTATPSLLNPGMGDDPVIVANSLLATSSGYVPQPVGSIAAAKAPVMSTLPAPQRYIANPDIVFAPMVAPVAKGGGAPSQPAIDQAHSSAYLIYLDAQQNPVLEEQPWGEDEVMIESPYSPGNGGPGWNTAGESVLGSAEQLADNVVSGVAQGAQAIAQSHGYDGTTDAYPFSYGEQGYQSARNSFASTNAPSAGGLVILLLVLWVIFK